MNNQDVIQLQKNRENSLLILCKSLDTKTYLHLIPRAEAASFWKVAEVFIVPFSFYRALLFLQCLFDLLF